MTGSQPILSKNVSKTYIMLPAKCINVHYATRSLEFKIDVKFNNAIVDENEHVKFLGVVIVKSLKFTQTH